MARAIDAARDILRSVFGYPDFRPGQSDVVASIVAGVDTLGVLPTGGGKSLCYQVPALARDGLTVVVSPLISLMKDQVERLQSKNVPATYVNSTLSDEQTAERLTALASGSIKLVYVAPERLESTGFLSRLRSLHISLLAVDEAHCISEWGHDFRPSFRRIAAAHAATGRPQIVALTATATPHVRRDIVDQLAMRSPRIIVAGFDRPNLSYAVRHCVSDADKQTALVTVVRATCHPAIVYAATRSAVERVSRCLTKNGVRSAAYHGGMHETDRTRAQDDFMNAKIQVIVATNAFGMGIDKSDVRLVAHYSMPGTLEAYYQEAGRAGRDGRKSECVLLHAPHDHLTHEWFIRGTYPDRTLVASEFTEIVNSQTEGVIHRRPAGRAQIAAHRLLERHGVLAPGTRSRTTSVRLLASPARIQRELSGVERQWMRDLWRTAGAQLERGIDLDLGRLRSRIAPRMRAQLMKALRDRQFLDFVSHSTDASLATHDHFDALPIDWNALDRRLTNDLMKLDKMKAYVHTLDCRRAFVLRYFGEKARGPLCGACDNCLKA